MPALALVENTSPTEVEIRRLTETRRAVDEERQALMSPVARLRDVIANADAVERELGEHRAADAAALDRWLAANLEAPDGTPEPQHPSVASREAEQRFVAAQRRADAARRALPAAEQAVEGCNLRIGDLSRQIAAAISALGLEKLDRFLAGPFTQAITAAARAETTALALEQVMWRRGNAYGAAAVRASVMARARAGLSHNIRALSDADAVVATAAFERSKALHQPDVAAAEKFLSGLLVDPGLEIE